MCCWARPLLSRLEACRLRQSRKASKSSRLVTSWPENLPGSGVSAERLAQSITAMSDGHLKVTLYPDGSLVHAFEVFDAVSAGVADMYHSADYYFEGKSPALTFFAQCHTA